MEEMRGKAIIHVENKQQNGSSKFFFSSNYFKCKQTRLYNPNREFGRIWDLKNIMQLYVVYRRLIYSFVLLEVFYFINFYTLCSNNFLLLELL